MLLFRCNNCLFGQDSGAAWCDIIPFYVVTHGNFEKPCSLQCVLLMLIFCLFFCLNNVYIFLKNYNAYNNENMSQMELHDCSI